MVDQGIQNHLAYIDETGFNLRTKKKLSRRRVGDRVIRQLGGRWTVTYCDAAISDIWLIKFCLFICVLTQKIKVVKCFNLVTRKINDVHHVYTIYMIVIMIGS